MDARLLMQVGELGSGLAVLIVLCCYVKPIYWAVVCKIWHLMVSGHTIERTLCAVETELSRIGMPQTQSPAEPASGEGMATAWQWLVSAICGGSQQYRPTHVLAMAAGLASNGALCTVGLPLVEKLALLQQASERLQPAQAIRFQHALHGTSRLIAAARYD
ncbi:MULTISPECIES: hypothetical protein [unclassified Paludibacterium]|uniref:hypothetical protein n=1 Tax=unclassified Paludibacterium TaxID=2618429 RepID=UPI001C05B998|nr:hypothetical protein [Paludibacterium sp. B53371]BEV73171.1 hypothetical protein THUN1379_26530 [Paludibacterium sp. THUN1379]